jgi:flavin reductase (DIM6/NTAB) family NADH-FMN oxidoreductase RutF
MDPQKIGHLFERVDREVWIVTAAHAGRRAGLVATFVAPASIVPEMPRVIAGIAKTHETQMLIEASGAFAVHLLDESQTDLVWLFGLQSSRSVDKFAGLPVQTAATGSPILRDALAWLDCRIEMRMDTGDRTVYLGDVLDCGSRSEARPRRSTNKRCGIRWRPTPLKTGRPSSAGGVLGSPLAEPSDPKKAVSRLRSRDSRRLDHDIVVDGAAGECQADGTDV